MSWIDLVAARPTRSHGGRNPESILDTLKTGKRLSTNDEVPVVPVRPHLFVVLECDRVLSGGARYELTDLDEVIIGRGSVRSAVVETDQRRNRLVLRIPGRSMSNVHARMFCKGLDWLLEDLGSTNGSYVNGQRVNQATLVDGDCIELGHTLLTMRAAVPTPATTQRELDSLTTLPQCNGLGTLSPLLANAYVDLAKVARSSTSVVLTGKTGTGKEVAARAVHNMSGRPGPFIAINCGALSANLVESQLFGHARGAFSGAIRDEIGLIRSSDHGTLFLDEIGELPQQPQVALLRVLQQAEVVPVGSPRATSVDIRVVAATHLGLGEMTSQGRFREDLRGRLEGHAVELPTLRERREDLGLLIASILGNITPNPPVLRPATARMLFAYHWPLNIRELEQVLKRALALSEGEAISPSHLPDSITHPETHRSDTRIPSRCTTQRRLPSAHALDANRDLRVQLVGWLEEHQGNVSRVARVAGKTRTQVKRWMKRFAIDPDDYRAREE